MDLKTALERLEKYDKIHQMPTRLTRDEVHICNEAVRWIEHSRNAPMDEYLSLRLEYGLGHVGRVGAVRI